MSQALNQGHCSAHGHCQLQGALDVGINDVVKGEFLDISLSAKVLF